MEITKQQKIILICFGSIVGIALGLGVGYTLKYFLKKPVVQEGAEFENISDFRAAMLGSDERDVKEDNNVSLRTLIQPDASDLIIYTLKPNLDVKFQGVNVKTNSFGLRGPEITKEKPKDSYRIAFLGDSFVFGWGVDEDKTFVRVMEKELNQSNKLGKKVEVLNFGVPGYSTFQEVELFKNKAMEFNPDAVIVYFVENDFGLPFFIKNFSSPDGELVSNQHFERIKKDSEDTEFEDDNQNLLKSLDANKMLRKLAEFCQERSIPVHLVVNPNKKYDKQISKLWVLRSNNYINVLNIREDVKVQIEASGLDAEQLKLPGDPHPNAIKHGFIGKSLAKAIVVK